MIDVRQTANFCDWLDGLRDPIAVKAIKRRIVRLQAGLFGDAKPVGGGIAELRVDHGPGYRVYFVRCGAVVVILLCGGDKGSQQRDITRARMLADQWQE